MLDVLLWNDCTGLALVDTAITLNDCKLPLDSSALYRPVFVEYHKCILLSFFLR